MKTFDVLKITGYRGLGVPNSILRSGSSAGHLAIIFPGLHYTTGMPVCYYPGLVMASKGADILTVDYDYTRPAFRDFPDGEQAQWIAADASAALQAARTGGRYRRITLIGKSIGTIALGVLLAAEPALEQADSIWLTPILQNPRIRQQMMSRRHHGLFIIGTADGQYDPPLWEEVLRATGGRGLVLEGADHSLEIPGKPIESVRIMETIAGEIDRFIR
jgi:predicted alpha/beta hydrolase